MPKNLLSWTATSAFSATITGPTIRHLLGVLEDHGVPAGRLYIHREPATLLVMDIALLPDWRGRGIGTALMQWVCSQARAAGKSVTVSVEKYNRAQTLYRQLGFRQISTKAYIGPWNGARRKTKAPLGVS